MGCDIHLRLEKRLKKDKPYYNEIRKTDENGNETKEEELYYTDKNREWRNCAILGYDSVWSDRNYRMFAVLNNVRNYWELEPLEDRGFPEDACNSTIDCYTCTEWNSDGECPEDGKYLTKENFEYYVNKYHCKIFERKDSDGKVCKRMVKDLDTHSANWCTTQEMEECIDKVFKNEDGNYGGYVDEWLALLYAMKGYEASGFYECRAVFWFDN